MCQVADAALAAWQIPWWTAASLLIAAILYLAGFARLHRQMPARFPLSRCIFYMAGLAALAVALVSPLEALDDRLLITHMVQHLTLLVIAPPFLLLGAPQIPLIRALPPKLAKHTIGLLAKSRICRRIFDAITRPPGTLAIFSLVMLGWHLPAPFQAALRSDNWHIAEHGCMILAGFLFWYPVILPWPARERWPRWAFFPYLLIADAENTLLGAFMVLSGRLLYPFYASAARFDAITPMNDQVLAGAIMWVPGSLLFLVPALTILMKALRPQSLIQPQERQAVRPAARAAI
jgi:putative membrane protein